MIRCWTPLIILKISKPIEDHEWERNICTWEAWWGILTEDIWIKVTALRLRVGFKYPCISKLRYTAFTIIKNYYLIYTEHWVFK